MSDIGALELNIEELEDQSQVELISLDEDWFVTKYLQFHDEGKLVKGGKTRKYGVYNRTSKMLLGFVKWKTGWRQYAFFPNADKLFDGRCLRDIADFCYLVTVKHKSPLVWSSAKEKMKRWRERRIKQLTDRKKNGNLGLEVKKEIPEDEERKYEYS